jgi:copper chaperone
MTKLKIAGMSCQHCVHAVTTALQKVPGVDRVVEVSLERGEALIEGRAENALLVQAVEEEGYSAEVSV